MHYVIANVPVQQKDLGQVIDQHIAKAHCRLDLVGRFTVYGRLLKVCMFAVDSITCYYPYIKSGPSSSWSRRVGGFN